jgi:hypothetical protein
LYIQLGQLEQAQRVLSESQAICEEIQAEDLYARNLRNFAVLAMAQRDDAKAASLLYAGLTIEQAGSGPRYIIDTIEVMTALALRLNQPERALCLAAAVAAKRRQHELLAPPLARAALDQVVGEARRRLSAEEAEAAWAAGEAMTLDEAVAYALAQPENN